MNELQRIREVQNIERLRRVVDYAKAELEEALLKRQNRIMEDKEQ